MAEPDYATVQSYILIGKESDWGTPVACSKDLGLVQSFIGKSRRDTIEGRSASARDVVSRTTSKVTYDLPLTCQFQHGRILEYVFGSVGHAGGSDPYTHTYTAANTLPSFTLENGYNSTADSVMKYAGCRVNNFTMNFAESGVTWTADMISKSVAFSTSAQAAVVDTLEIHELSNLNFKVGVDGSEATLTDVRDLTLTISNGLISGKGANDIEISTLAPGQRTYTMSGRARFSRDDEIYALLGGGYDTSPTSFDDNATAFSAIIDLQNSANRQFYFKSEDCQYASFDPVVDIGATDVIADFEIVMNTMDTCYTKDDIASGSW